MLHERDTRLEIDGAVGHPAQTLSKRSERGRCERVLLTERDRVNSRNVELPKQHHHVATDECDIEIAGSRPVSVKRLAGLELLSGHGTPTKNYLDPSRRRIPKHAQKLFEPLRVTGKGELYYAVAIFALNDGIEGVGSGGRLVGRLVAGFFRHKTPLTCNCRAAGSAASGSPTVLRLRPSNLGLPVDNNPRRRRPETETAHRSRGRSFRVAGDLSRARDLATTGRAAVRITGR